METNCMKVKYISVIILAYILCPSYQVCAVTVKKITHLKDVDMVPDDVHKTSAIRGVSLFLQCQLECSKRNDCQTVLHDGDTCYLFNTSNGARGKRPGEIAATVMETEAVTNVDICQKLTPCLHNSTCLPTNNHPYYKCICPSWCYGDPCDNCYPIPGVLADDINLIIPGLILKAPIENDWIVLMRRRDGSVDFINQLWKDYKNGFGDHQGEFWLGNKWVHLLTTNSSYRVRFDLVTYNRSWAYAEYSHFHIGKEDDGYRLNVSDYSGTAGNSLIRSSQYNENGRKFKTSDRGKGAGCSPGGWWDPLCGFVRLTGRYIPSKDSSRGVIWHPFSRQLAYADMKIRRVA